MAASSALPRRARGTPGWTGRPGGDGGSQRSAAGTRTRGPGRCAQWSRAARRRAQVSLRRAHFKRANQRRPLRRGGASEDAPALPEVALVSWETDAARVRGVGASTRQRWSRDFTYEIQLPSCPMRKLRVCFPTARDLRRRSTSRSDSEVCTVAPAQEGSVLPSADSDSLSGFRITTPFRLPFSLFFTFPGLSSSFIYVPMFDPGHTEMNTFWPSKNVQTTLFYDELILSHSDLCP